MEQPVTGNRVRSIDGLRGWAAVAVVFYHAMLHYDPQLWQSVVDPPVTELHGIRILAKIVLTLFNGEYAVILFFLISGFVLQRSLYRYDRLDFPAAAQFLIRRVFRLMPSIFVSVTILYLLLVLGDPLTNVNGDRAIPAFQDYVANLFLVNTDLLSVTWTIRVEMIGAPFIFAFGFAERSLGFIGAVLAVIYSLYALQNPLLTGSILMMHSALLPFSIGMLAAIPGRGPAIRHPTMAVAACVVLFFLARFFVYQAQIAAVVSQIVIGATLLYVIANYPAPAVSRVLDSRLSQLLGRISYSFYLYAPIVGIYVTFALSFFLKPPETMAVPYGLAVGLLICLLTVPVAILAERFIERPGIVVGSWLASLTATARGLGNLRFRESRSSDEKSLPNKGFSHHQ
jgi:peptidoglycan/LPS O-acetylase OafA/YrhL